MFSSIPKDPRTSNANLKKDSKNSLTQKLDDTQSASFISSQANQDQNVSDLMEDSYFKAQSSQSWEQQNLTPRESGPVELTPENYTSEWQYRIMLEELHDKTEGSQNAIVILMNHNDKDQILKFFDTFDNDNEAFDFINKMKKMRYIRATLHGEEPNKQIFMGKRKKVSKPIQNTLDRNIFPGEYIVVVAFKPEDYHGMRTCTKSCQLWNLKEEKPSFYDQMRDSIMKIGSDEHKRRMIVDLEPPKFENNNQLSQSIKLYDEDKSLNSDQIAAIEHSLNTKDYSLILGMPGTGKTHAIVVLLRILIERGNKILLSSYTHFAVDNILLRFVKKYPYLKDTIARIGDVKKVAEDIRDLVSTKKRHDALIFAVTCLGTKNSLIKNQKFDVCIIDEASQILEPVALGPILLAEKFIMIGDHYQLPPLVKSEKAKEAGMGISLFERLATAHKDMVSWLTIQYRMNSDIMNFSNKVIYTENPMKCANISVEQGRLKIRANFDEKWIDDIIDPKTTIAFLDLEKVRTIHNENKRNLNCELTIFIVKKLLESGLEPDDIGVITPLNHDVNLVKSQLKRHNVKSYTIDKCQGIDKKCMIINFSLNKIKTRSLLADRRRVNVAFTRAKYKLIMIGYYTDLQKMEGIGSFITLVAPEHKLKMEEIQMKFIQSNQPNKDSWFKQSSIL